MNRKLIAAVPALALAAGLSLTACSGNSTPAASSAPVSNAGSQSCADFIQAMQDGISDSGEGALIIPQLQAALLASSGGAISNQLQTMLIGFKTSNGPAVQSGETALDGICDYSGPS